MKRRLPLHPCPVPDCSYHIEAWLILCADHWNRVPLEITESVCICYRRMKADPNPQTVADHRAAVRRALAFYAKEKP